jgi:hypothetical protein
MNGSRSFIRKVIFTDISCSTIEFGGERMGELTLFTGVLHIENKIVDQQSEGLKTDFLFLLL